VQRVAPAAALTLVGGEGLEPPNGKPPSAHPPEISSLTRG